MSHPSRLSLWFRTFRFNSRLALWLILFATGLTAAFAQRPMGMDVSDNEGTGILWPIVKNSGISFAWAKATEGLTLNDAAFTVNEANARAAGVLIGAYHYAHPDTHLGLSGADQEAAHFWSIISNYVTGKGTYLMPMLDFEQSVAGVSPAYTQATLSAWLNEWCQDIVNLGASNGVVVKPVVYTFVSYANGTGGFGPGMDSSVTQWPLWMAQYPTTPSPQTGAPSGTSPWASSAWVVWQYSSTSAVPGITGVVHDLDVFNGSAANFGTYVVGGLTKPVVFLQTLMGHGIAAGSNITFTASAGGSGSLSYQWAFNGNNIFGATASSLHLANVQPTDSGSYTVTVSNTVGTTTGAPIPLVVYPPQVTVFADNFDTNSAANWTVNRSSSDTAIAFAYDYSALGIPSAPNSTNGTTRGVQMKANLTQTVVAAISMSPIGQSFPGDYRLHFDGWINVNGPLPAGGASSTEYLSAGIGTAGNRTEWTGAGSTADGFYFTADGDGGVTSTTTSGDFDSYSGTTPLVSTAGDYSANSLDNATTYYETVFPTRRAPPALQTSLYSQQTGTLAQGTFGLAWHDVIVSRRGNVVNWVVDGVILATIPNATFTASNIFVGFWDPFSSLTDNTNLSFGLVDNLRVEVPATIPVLTLSPQSQTVPLGTNVIFMATATGLPAPTYQWTFNTTNIPDATNSTYAIAVVTQTNVGNYSVTVSNLAGDVVSTPAALALVAPRAAQFTSINVQSGNQVQLNFTGDPLWTYTIQTSTNLTDWITLTNLVSADGLFTFTPVADTNSVQQFFRALVTH